MSLNFNNNILNKAASLLRISNEDLKNIIIKHYKIFKSLPNNNKIEFIKFSYTDINLKVDLNFKYIIVEFKLNKKIVFEEYNIKYIRQEIVETSFEKALISDKKILIDFISLLKTIKASFIENLHSIQLNLIITENNEKIEIIKRDYYNYNPFSTNKLLDIKFVSKDIPIIEIENGYYKSKFIEDIKIKYKLDIENKDIKRINDIIKLLIY